ncbi:hypothetical protein [Nocardia nova]
MTDERGAPVVVPNTTIRQGDGTPRSVTPPVAFSAEPMAALAARR